MKIFSLIFFLLFETLSADKVTIVQTLTTKLLTGYNKNVRPNYLTEMSFELQLNQILAVDEKNQVMTSSFYLKMLWQDPRLTWTESDYENVTQILIPALSLWLPDSYIINTADANGFITYTSSHFALLSSDGYVYLIINLSAYKTKCAINVLGFPYDYQKCKIIIGSWQYDNTRLLLQSNNTYLNMDNYIQNPVWNLISTIGTDVPSTDRFDTYMELKSTDVVFELLIKRRPTNYMLSNLFPCFLLNVITLISFWLPFNTAYGASIY